MVIKKGVIFLKKKLFACVLATSLATSFLLPNVEKYIHHPVVEAAEPVAPAFSDVGSLDSKTKTKIQQLVDKGIISGFTDNTFRPNQEVTRGQFALFISRALKLPQSREQLSGTLSDVTPAVSTYDGIVKVLNMGIVTGYLDGKFRPNSPITRNEMAIMIDKALQLTGEYEIKEELTYSDKGSIGKSAYEPIQRLTQYGIMKAYSGSAFKGVQKGTRLETVLSIWELLRVIEEHEARQSAFFKPAMSDEEARLLHDEGKPYEYRGFWFKPLPFDPDAIQVELDENGNWVEVPGPYLPTYVNEGNFALRKVFPGDAIKVHGNLYEIGVPRAFNVKLQEHYVEHSLVNEGFHYIVYGGLDMTKEEFATTFRSIEVGEKRIAKAALFEKKSQRLYSVTFLE